MVAYNGRLGSILTLYTDYGVVN